jgi:NDP-sugar pyrophosphorylase family protein
MKKRISITLDENLFGGLEGLIDGVKIRNLSQAIEFLIRKSMSEKRCAVILAGGSEERLKVGSAFSPLFAVGNKTVIERMVTSLKSSKFTEIYVVGRKAVLSDIFKKMGDGSSFGVTLNYVEETGHGGGGTAGTLRLLKGRLNAPFICLYCDIVFDYDLEKIWNFHIRNYGTTTLLLKTSKTPVKHGVVGLEGDKVISFMQKPKTAASYIVYGGIFIADQKIFDVPGNSLEYDVFPQLASERVLTGYVCSGTSRHIHGPR